MPFIAMKSITLRLRIAFLIVAATTLCAGLAAIWVFRSVDQTYSSISHESYPATRAIAGLEKNALEVALALHLLSGANDEAAREDAFRQLGLLLKQAPTHLTLLESLHSTENQALAAQYAQITKQSAETNQIIHDLIDIDQQNRQIVQQVEQLRSEFEKNVDPLLRNAKEDLLLAAAKTSTQAGEQWTQLTEAEKSTRLGLTEVRSETFRLITVIAMDGDEGFQKKGPEIINRIEAAIARTHPEFRVEGIKMVKALRAPMQDVGRDAAAAMLAFYRDTNRLNRKQTDEMNHSGELITQNATTAVVNLVNTQVQTLTASEQLKSSYFQLASILRKMIWSPNDAALKAETISFLKVYQSAHEATRQINNPLFKKAQLQSQAALAELEKQHKQITALTTRRIMLKQLLERIARENQGVTNALLTTTHELATSVSGNLTGQVSTLDQDIKRSTHLMMIATSIAMLIALLVGWVYVSRNLGNRLERLAEAMRALSRGELADNLLVQGHDEISDIEQGVVQFRALLVQQREQNEALSLARDEAQAAVKMKSEFLANMSHEIRTPLTAILGYTNLVAENELNSVQRQYIGRAQNSAQMLLGVVNDVLDFSKIEANKLQIESSPFDLMQLFSQLAGTVAIQAQEKGLRLSFEIAPDVPTWLEGDALRLGQVLLNLLNNAIKFTEHGEVNLYVRCVREDEHLIGLNFVVEDSGIGISNEAQARLFNLFSQADSSTTRRFGGTGLGLAISQQLIHLMGGDIHVHSEVGFGSEFSFTLEFSKHYQRADAITCLEPRRVVIADSNPDHALHLSQHLQSLGFECVVLNNPAQLLTYLHSGHQIDLLLLEVKLCHGANSPVCEQLQQLYRDGLPIILLCYGLDDVSTSQNSALRDCQLLIKPLVPSHIRAVVAQTLRLNQQPDLGHASAVADQDALQGLRILLVEDTDILLDLGVTILRNMGAQVTAVSSGNAAIAAVMSMTFDVVLMDVQMPDMDGRDTTRAIRALPGFDRLPILALTAHAMEGERELCLQAGMNDHLSKPIDALKLKHALQVYLPDGGVHVSALASVEPISSSAPVAGVDFLTALQRMGSMKMLKKMLPRFIERFSDSASQLRQHINTGQLAEAERLAHTLKGVAGQVEAAEVMRLAANLELELHQGHTDLQPQLFELETQLAEACRQIEQWLSVNAENELSV